MIYTPPIQVHLYVIKISPTFFVYLLVWVEILSGILSSIIFLVVYCVRRWLQCEMCTPDLGREENISTSTYAFYFNIFIFKYIASSVLIQ